MTKQIGAEGWSGRKSPTDTVFPSMSTLAGNTLAAPSLENWMIEETAKRTVAQMGTLAHRATTDPDGVIETIKGIRWERQPGVPRATDLGTFLHEVLENWLHGLNSPPVPLGWEPLAQPMIDQLTEWMRLHRPVLVSAEACIFNFDVPAAGRYDNVIEFGAGPWHGRRMLCDLKTAAEPRTGRGYDKKPYADSVALQLAGYRWSRHYATFDPRTKEKDRKAYLGRAYLLNDAEKAVLGSTEELWGISSEDLRTAVIHLTPEWCRTFEVETGPEVLDALKAVRAAWTWKTTGHQNLIHPYVEGAS